VADPRLAPTNSHIKKKKKLVHGSVWRLDDAGPSASRLCAREPFDQVVLGRPPPQAPARTPVVWAGASQIADCAGRGASARRRGGLWRAWDAGLWRGERGTSRYIRWGKRWHSPAATLHLDVSSIHKRLDAAARRLMIRVSLALRPVMSIGHQQQSLAAPLPGHSRARGARPRQSVEKLLHENTTWPRRSITPGVAGESFDINKGPICAERRNQSQ